jgi:D-glycero-alpha-D-manno-heptose 1-phosphate guanylyltransferase
MLKEAIILAGGFGTRLQAVVADRPKPMAMVAGKPFLHYILQYLKHYNISKIVLSIGYKAEMIQDYFGDQYNGISIDYALEKQAMGTGGGIRLALEKCKDKEILVLNGDSFFNINLYDFYSFYKSQYGDVSVAVREIENAARYGTIEMAEDGKIIAFKEKNGLTKPGLINAGIYIIKRDLFLMNTYPNKNFSIEKDFFENNVGIFNLSGFLKKGYFIDIGIPEDYAKAQKDFKEFNDFPFINMNQGSLSFGGRRGKCSVKSLKDLNIDKSWTLFLDRDGVINVHSDGYVKETKDFHFTLGALEAIKELSKIFGRIVVVTNQQGIGKNVMTIEELNRVHDYMINMVNQYDGRLDKIYFAPQLESEKSIYRKPNTGMALQAKQDFPEIDFNKSVMVGDFVTDMLFGKTIEAYTVYVGNSADECDPLLIDFRFSSLFEFSKEFKMNEPSSLLLD